MIRQGDDERSGRVDTRAGRDSFGVMLDSVRHLFEVPWSPATVPFRRGLNPTEDGREGIFLTWGADPRPTRAYDQVALWSRDGRIVRMDTTGRDVAPFIVAQVDFTGTVELGTLRLPKSATVLRPNGGGLVHRWELLQIRRIAGRQAGGGHSDRSKVR